MHTHIQLYYSAIIISYAPVKDFPQDLSLSLSSSTGFLRLV